MAGDLLSILQCRINVLEAKIKLNPQDQYLRGQLFAMETALNDARAELGRAIFGPKELLPG